MADVVPYILSIFSNPPKGQPGHLSYIEDEQKAMLDLFTKAKTKAHLDYAPMADDPNAQQISDHIRQFGKLLSIIHYSGHANEELLSLDEGDLRAERFIRYVQDCTNTKLVILNGCSTQGFVKELLEKTNVRTVIATSRPVRDDLAALFSKSFYDRLLEGSAVADAFTWALSVVLEDYTADTYIYRANKQNNTITTFDLINDTPAANGTRAVKTPGKVMLDKAKEAAPWGIFTTSNDLLSWTIFEKTDAEKRLEEIEAQIKEKTRTIIDWKMDAQDLTDDIADIDNKIAPTANDLARKTRKQKDLDETRQLIDEANRQIEQLGQEMRSLSDDQNIDDLIKSLTASLKRLNYESQDSEISTLQYERETTPQQFYCFILHGDYKSCLHLLSHRMRNWLGFESEKRATFDFDASDMDGFWQKVQRDMEVETLSNDPDKAIKRLMQFYRDPATKRTINDLLLIFRNKKKDGAAIEVFNRQVFGHWEDFITRFKAADTGEKYDHYVYAFIIDEACEVTLNGECHISSGTKTYEDACTRYPSIRSTVKLLSPVDPLKPRQIWDWQRKEALRSDYRYTQQQLENIVRDKKGVFLDTVVEFGSGKASNPINATKVSQAIKQDIDTPI